MGIETAMIGSAVIGAGASIGGSLMSSSASGKAGEAAGEAQAQNAQLSADLIKNGTNYFLTQREAALGQTQAAKDDSYRALVSGLGRTDQAYGFWDNAVSAGRGDLNNALAEWDAKYGAIRNDNQAYTELGRQSATGYSGLLSDPSSIVNNPGYQFRLSQGQTALDSSAAAKGRLLSGPQAKAMTEYGQNYATSEYDNALARYNTGMTQGQQAQGRVDNAGIATANGKSQIYNNLANLVMAGAAGKTGVSQYQAGQYQSTGNYLSSADTQMANIEQQTGQNVVGLWSTTMGKGQSNNAEAAQARGSSYMNESNAINKGLEGVGNAANSGVNNYLMSKYLDNKPIAPSSAALGIISRY